MRSRKVELDLSDLSYRARLLLSRGWLMSGSQFSCFQRDAVGCFPLALCLTVRNRQAVLAFVAPLILVDACSEYT